MRLASSVLPIIGTIAWCLIVVSEYYHWHSWYPNAIAWFAYMEIVLFLVGTSAAVIWFRMKSPLADKVFEKINGLVLFGMSWLLAVVCTIVFFSKIENIKFDGAGMGHFTEKYWGIALAVWAVIGVCYAFGDRVWKWFPAAGTAKETKLLKIAMGMVVLVFLMFILGAFRVLYPEVLGAVMLLGIVQNLDGGKEYALFTLIRPIQVSVKLNAVGILSFSVLLLFVTLNYIQVLRPIPLGFDASSLYVRLPVLMENYNGLVEGHGVYNWGILMSIGNVFFGKLEVVLALSFVGGVLSLFGLYALGRRWMETNHVLLALVGFYTLPVITYHSSKDMKVDLGLLYMSICLVTLLVKYRKSFADEPFSLKSQSFRMWCWMGVILGFSFGIKFTAVLLLIAALAGLWYAKDELWGFLGITFLMMFMVLFLKLDARADLRVFHAGVGYVQWSLAVAGIGMLVWKATKDFQGLLHKLKMSSVILLVFTASISPWIVKNSLESRNLSVNSLLNGKKSLPKVTIQTLEENYQRSKGQ